MYASALVLAYGLFVPLRLATVIASRRFLGPISLAFATVLGAAAAAYLLSFAVDSRSPVLAFVGNLLFVVLLVCIGVVIVRASFRRISTLAPRVASNARAAFDRIRLQLTLVSLYFISDR